MSSRLRVSGIAALALGLAGVLPVAGPAFAGAPEVTTPVAQVSSEGESVSLAIEASDPDGDPLGFGASGLPPGLAIDALGVISGSIPEAAAGSYEVQVDVSDAIDVTSVQFTWTVLPGTLGSGQILWEWWTGIAGTAVSDLTGSPAYPDDPTGSDFLSSFEAPTDWTDSYGTRMRGYLYPPVTGSYRFWIAADDTAELWLSSDAMPANAALVAHVPGPTSPRSWDTYPEQASVPIPLVAGQRYYIEALQKEDADGDNLAVAWEGPVLGMDVIDGLYLSPLEFDPSVEPLPDQLSLEGETLALQVQASDPNGDSLGFSALGLPPGLAIDPVSGLISGSIAIPAAGVYAVTVDSTDPSGHSTSIDFAWTVAPENAWLLGPVNKGVACQDEATGSGYLMYSAQNVRDRFRPAPTSANSANFICVVLVDGQWYYDDNHAYNPFTPLPTDLLVAAVDFDADTATDLIGQQGAVNGMALGYQDGDLVFIPNWYDGVFQRGEFTVSGGFLVANPAVCGNAAVEPGEECDGTTCCSTTCSFEAPGTLCADGNVCTEFDSCDGAGVCLPGGPVGCDDGLYCNGAEVCDPASGCVAGAPPALDDGVACTVDACDEGADVVTHAPEATLCDDGLYCNGAETCDPASGCVAGPQPAVDDGVACTVDACDEDADAITHAPDASICDDGLYCNGAEACDPASGCVAGPPPVVDDGVACTVDGCDEGAGAITHVPDATACDDGDPCTAEACDALAGCTSTPVTGGACGDALPPTVPALPPWGRPVLLVLLLASSRAALRQVGRRR